MWRGIPELVRHHVKGGTANYPMGIYITLVHILASVGVCYVRRCKPETLLFSVVLWWLSGFGITVGVHRLWSHRSYTAALPLRVLLMIWNSIANQGSIYHWARDHRVYHKFSETDADPHNATRGFFFAHMGWLYVKKHKRVVEAGRDLNFDDLKVGAPAAWPFSTCNFFFLDHQRPKTHPRFLFLFLPSLRDLRPTLL